MRISLRCFVHVAKDLYIWPMQSLSQSIGSLFAVQAEEMAHIQAAFKRTELAKGDFFQRKGRTGERMAFLQTGLLRIYDTVNDKEITQWISTPGYFITDIAAFSFGVRARWDMQAIADCTLHVITREDYVGLGKNIPAWNDIDRRFLAKCFAMMEDRIFGFISLTAEERYHKLFHEQRDLFLQVPLQYLASMLGMTPETLSRIRKKTERIS